MTTGPGSGEIEPAPEAARAVFGDRLPLAVRYADLLAGEAAERGLIGPSEGGRIWSRHLLNSAVVGELVPTGADVLDVGSGAGLPGIPLAIARPDLSLVLVEPLLRRSTWLTEVIARLELDRVTVIRARAEELHGELSATCVTARAVAPMGRLAGWCLPLVRPGGTFLALKGQSAEVELAGSASALRTLGAQESSVAVLGLGILADPTWVVQVRVGSSERPVGRSAAEKRSARRRRQGGER